MTEETTTPAAENATPTKEAPATQAEPKGEKSDTAPRGSRPPRRGGRRRPQEPKEFEESILDIARVTRVVKGGRRMRFRITVVIGDKKGRVGLGTGKSSEVLEGIKKAVASAKKQLVNVSMVDGTIPHQVDAKFKASKVMILPAVEGKGIIAGGAVRKILELAGYKDVLSKAHGSRNTLNLAYATFEALAKLQKVKKAEPKTEKKEEKSQEKSVKKAPAKKAAPKKAVKKETK